MSLFSFSDLGSVVNGTGAISLGPGGDGLTSSKKFKTCRPGQALADVVGVLERNTDLHFVTAGSWALHDLALYCARAIGPCDFVGFTWSLTGPASDVLIKAKLDGVFRSMKMVVDGSMSKWSRGALSQLEPHSEATRVLGIHAKGFLLSNSSWCVAVVSSANFSNNPRIEAGVLSTVPAVFQFHSTWLERVLFNGDAFERDLSEPHGVELQESELPERALFIIRGLPGSGKSTLGALIATELCENDEYFIINGHYNFEKGEIRHAVGSCLNKCRAAMERGVPKIAVSNTFLDKTLIEPYIVLAKNFNYPVFQMIIENTHGSTSVHAVNSAVVASMRKRFRVNL